MQAWIPATANWVVQNAGDIMGLFGSNKDRTNYKAQYKNASQLQKEAYKQSLKQLKKEYTYNKKLMSNSAKATQALNQSLMDYQYGLERDSRQHSFGDTRIDIETAGYNPLLAVGQQSNYTPVSSGVSATSAGVEGTGIANSASEIANRFNEMRNANKMVGQGQQRIDIDRLAGSYQNDLNSAKAEHERSMTRGQDIANGIENLFGYDKALADLDLTRGQREMIEYAKQKTLADIDYLSSSKALNSANAYKAMQEGRYVGYNAQTGRYNAQTGRYNAQTARYNATKNQGQSSNSNTSTSVKAGPFGFSWSSGSGRSW